MMQHLHDLVARDLRDLRPSIKEKIDIPEVTFQTTGNVYK